MLPMKQEGVEIQEPVIQQVDATHKWVSPRSALLKNVREKARSSALGVPSPTLLPLKDLLRKPLSVLKKEADTRCVCACARV